MKKIIILFLLLAVSVNAIAQETDSKFTQDVNKKHELKINAFNLIAFSALDVSYEKLVNANSSYGVSLFYNFSEIGNTLEFNKRFSLTPYYRWFFSESQFARGFFVEGFGMFNNFENNDSDYDYNTGRFLEYTENRLAFALGISVGGKFITKQGFITEVHLGIGRNLITQETERYFSEADIVGRFGISLGYRF